jgi:hypothetical protein
MTGSDCAKLTNATEQELMYKSIEPYVVTTGKRRDIGFEKNGAQSAIVKASVA